MATRIRFTPVAFSDADNCKMTVINVEIFPFIIAVYLIVNPVSVCLCGQFRSSFRAQRYEENDELYH